MTFTIPGRLLGLNDIIGAARSNRFSGASQKKKETHKCQMYILAGKVPTYSSPVKISFTWIESDRRRDLDNICAGAKFVLDALVANGNLPNDGRKWVKGISHSFPEPDAKNPRVEIEIEDFQ